MTEKELAELNQLWLTMQKDFIQPIGRQVKAHFSGITNFFETIIQNIGNFCKDYIPDTFIITRRQFILLVIACLYLCFYITKQAKRAKPKQQKEIVEEAKRLNRVTQTIPKSPKVLGKTWYPTGWTYSEAKKLWEPPDFLSAEAKDRWVWDPEKEVWIDLYKDKKEK